jgi:hypothetical protein
VLYTTVMPSYNVTTLTFSLWCKYLRYILLNMLWVCQNIFPNPGNLLPEFVILMIKTSQRFTRIKSSVRQLNEFSLLMSVLPNFEALLPTSGFRFQILIIIIIIIIT